ncbi:unnamed protein product, partial [Strongylus vulgaris]
MLLTGTLEVTTTVQIPSAATSVSRLIEELKLQSAEEAHAFIGVTTCKEVVQKTVTIRLPAEDEAELQQEIVSHPQNTKWKDLKESVTLTCTTKKDIEHASWFKNGMKVETSEFISIVTERNETKISLKQFNPYYIGVYHVVVDNIGSQPARVSANVAPIIESKLPSKIVHKIGRPLDLQLTYAAYPAPHVKLHHENSAITLLADIDQYEDSLSIRIKDLRKEDDGLVSILLSNEHGKTETSFVLQLVDTPLAPQDAHIVELTPTTVTMEWSSPDIDESDIIHYIVERRMAESRRWRKMTKTAKKVYKCTDLVPNEFYAFRILAVNSYGEGLPSNVLEADMPPETEEDILPAAITTEDEVEEK